MSDPSAAAPAEQTFIDLKVLSPSTEVDGDMFFKQLPASTTVAELKLKIKDQIAAKPAVERMRLIYRGRVMAKESDTMTDVFGRDEIRASSEQSLHLVLREFAHSSHPHNPSSTSSTPIPRNSVTPAPRSSTVPPQNPFRTGPPSPALGGPTPPPQTNPFRAPAQGRQPVQPHQNHVHHMRHHHNAFPHLQPFPFPMNGQPGVPPQLPIPPELQNLLQQQAQQQAQAAGQLGTNQAGPQQNGQTPPEQQNGAESGTQTNARAPASRNAFQDYVARQQQQRAATGSPGAGINGANATPGDNREPGNGTPPGLPFGAIPPNTSSTIRHEGIGPNGQRWTMTVNSTNVTTGPGQQPPNFGRAFPHPPHMPLPPFMNGRIGSPNPNRQIYSNMDRDLARIRSSLQAAQREMENIRLLINADSGELTSNLTTTGSTTPTWRHGTVRQHMQNLLGNLDELQTALNSLVADPQLARNRDIVSLQMLNNSLRQQADGLVESIDRLQENVENSRATNTNGATDTSSTSTPTQANPSNLPQPPASTGTSAQTPATAPGPELFLLSGPQGPVGLLFDERGTYTTAPFSPTLPFDTFNQQFNANRQVLAGFVNQVAQVYQQQPATNPAQGQNQQPQNANQNPATQPGQPAAQQAQPGQAAEPPANGIGVATHFWLLFKLIAFIYLFAGGTGWRRPVMMGITGIIVYLAQLGLFENQFDRVRRHFEALLPLAEREVGPGQRPRPEAAQGGDSRRAPTPEETAQRLIREHEERERGWMRERIRVVERAVALFVASLWPGLGERMVRAREERVAAERREEERLAAEEQAKAEREAKEKEEAEGEKAEGEGIGEAGEASGSGKGKEKAIVPEAGEASGSEALHTRDEEVVR
ncbi:uncharacterized protein BDZ99DRAFT_458028 [Mytilinidion resinicola]|uniref:Ubiquitin-like domain-containing protein n=1 Tax=Mytilinidion resinicola TaxID=574789 RepID=A0A6A6Z797_9PEZI|nr:uncharacterized protein BDZ99DRAFT_458028 [Mytilinidion resinicola]KAF2816125.1 hypothetical protein BDZ99DRAFT_458028 [Mytilinidion resinicola]